MQSSQPQLAFAARASSRPSKKAPPAANREELAMAAIRHTPDDAELTRRLISLISLLGIYAVGLVVVAFVSDGPDIGVLLAALLGHAIFIGTRYIVRENRERRTLVSAGARGVVVYARRARFIRYRDIAVASATDTALTLRVRAGKAGALADVVLRWSDSEGEREALVSRIDGRVRRSQRIEAKPRVRSVAARSRESIARVAAAISDLAGPQSSTHITAAG